MSRKIDILTGLDIGSSAIKGLVAQKRVGNDELGVLAYFSIPSNGIRKGVVADTESASEAIKQVVAKLRAVAKPHRIKELYTNINGSHISSIEAHGAVAISRADQKVSKEDLDRVTEEARNLNLPFNQEILDMFPMEFIVDGEGGLTDIEGMKGIKLEVRALAVNAFSLYLKKVIESVLNSDVDISEVIASPVAASEAVLTPQQKELGVVLVDIGAETTGVAVYEEKNLIHLAVLPVGSANITRDIAICLQTDVEIAEEIKLKFGSYIFKNKRKKEKINVEEEVFEFDTQKMIQAGKARVSEIFNLVNKELKKINKQAGLPAGVVLTGGGSKLTGIVDFCKKELKLPVKKGVAKGFVGLDNDPSLSVVSGLILHGFKNEGPIITSDRFVKVRKIFRTFLP